MTPWIPSRRNLRTFVLGGIWVCWGGLVPAAIELWQALTRYKVDPIDWPHIMVMAGGGVGPMAWAYWRKYKALLEPPPEPEATCTSPLP